MNRGNVLRMGGGNRNGREGVIDKKEGEMKTEKGKKRRGLSHVGEMVGGAYFVIATALISTISADLSLTNGTIVTPNDY